MCGFGKHFGGRASIARGTHTSEPARRLLLSHGPKDLVNCRLICSLIRCALFWVKGCLLGGGLFYATVSSNSRRDWEEGRKQRPGNDGKGEAVSLRSFYWSLRGLVGASANELVVKRFVTDVVWRLNKPFLQVFMSFQRSCLQNFLLYWLLPLESFQWR